MMADESDDCRDVVRYWNKLNEGYECVFGSRFSKDGGAIDYPWLKRLSLDHHSYHLEKPALRQSEIFDKRDGEPLSFHLPICVA